VKQMRGVGEWEGPGNGTKEVIEDCEMPTSKNDAYTTVEGI
jgi:hypothetical protein